MSAVELASRLRDLGVSLWAEDGALRYRAPRGVMTPELKAELAVGKPGLLELLGEATGGAAYAAIRPVERNGTAPLSFAQERLWFMEQLEPGNAFFNIDTAIRLRFGVDVRALQLALDEIVRRHESLRTTFAQTPDGPVQVIAPRLRIGIELDDLRGGPSSEREQRATALAEQEARRPFDIARGPLVRARLGRLAPDDHLLALTMHHIVSDGWSMGIFWRELGALYEGFAGGRRPELPALPVQYADFAVWQRRHLEGDGLRGQIDYWRERLAGAAELELPTDHPRPRSQRFRGAHAALDVAPDVAQRLADLAHEESATPFMVYMAAFQALLARYTSQDDIVVGSYIANRNHVEVEGLIGFFVNTLVFRGDLSGDPSFRGLVRRLREVSLGAYANQDVPFPRLVEELAPRRDPSRNPIFQIAFQLFNAPTVSQPGTETEQPLPIERGTAVFDLVLSLWPVGAGLGGHVEYDTDLFEAATIARMIGHLTTLLAAAAEDPERRLSELPIMGAQERRRVLRGAVATTHDVDLRRGLVERFGEQASQRPEAVAFVHGQRPVTYGEIDRRATALARTLRGLGVGREEIVGVCLARSPEAVIAILAVLAAGGAWLPLDPAYPAARLRFMTEDAGARLVLVHGRAASEAMAGANARVLDLDALEPTGGAEVAPVPAAPGPRDLAYVIYTSGSTGTPKGVAVEHAQILNRLEWMWRTFPFAPGEVCAQKTPLSFVDSIWEIFGPLLQGVPTAILGDDAARDPALLIDELARHRITRVWLVPGMLRAVLDAADDLARRLPDLRFWVTTGEQISVELYERFTRALPGATLHNCYGTSEFWDATWHDPRGAPAPVHRVPIGRLIANMRAYVLDRHGELVPTGVPGELHVGGLGLARGYVGRPELTAERFRPDPFADDPEARIYATGDRARVGADGALEFLGRLDAQLKVRGMRVEPGEVEDALARHPAVRECAVRLEPSGADGLLAAYVEPREPPGPETDELRRFLRARLPEPMVPGRFTVVERLARTPSGKVDRRALEPPAVAAPARAGARRIAPRSALERLIAGVWQEVLGLPEVGVADDFFDLGGHSLLGTQVVARVRSALDVELPLRRLFEAPTVSDLAAALRDEEETGATLERRAELVIQLSELSDDRVAALLADGDDPDGRPALERD